MDGETNAEDRLDSLEIAVGLESADEGAEETLEEVDGEEGADLEVEGGGGEGFEVFEEAVDCHPPRVSF